MSFLAEFFRFLRVRRKIWLMPIMLVMLAFGGLVLLTNSAAIAPFIYTLF